MGRAVAAMDYRTEPIPCTLYTEKLDIIAPAADTGVNGPSLPWDNCANDPRIIRQRTIAVIMAMPCLDYLLMPCIAV